MDRYNDSRGAWSMTAFGPVPRLGDLVSGGLPTPPWSTHPFRTCTHPNCELRLKKYDSGAVQARRQCLVCGQVAGGQPEKKTAGLPDWDADLEALVRDEYQRLEAEYHEALSRHRDRAEQRRSSERSAFWQFYNEYLRSWQWKRKRQLVLSRCAGICESCGEATATQVHHVRYPDVLGQEPLWDLRGVCEPCHRIIHPHMD